MEQVEESLKHNFVKPTEKDMWSVRQYLKRDTLNSLQDVQLVWDLPSYRREQAWEALALKFKDGLSQDDLIETIVNIRAEEYWGMQDGYHIFWFD